MSKSKEEYVHIINKKFNDIDNKKDRKSLFLALEDSIKYITNSEFSLVFLIDNHKKVIKTFYNNRGVEVFLEASILKDVFLSKKYFFDNYVVNNHKYNEKIDNILNIEIKSIIIVPIIDKIKGEVVACISAFNSVNHNGEFKRYDVRSLGLLEHYIFDLIKLSNNDETSKIIDNVNIKKREIEKTQVIKTRVVDRPIRKTKVELEAELKLQQEKIRVLESELSLKIELLENKDKELQEYTTPITIVEEEKDVLESDIYTVLEFLTNEVRYLANEEHRIHLFLEIIKNSLHNKEQLHFLNSELEKIGLIEHLATTLYTREKMPIIIEPFNIYQLVNDVAIFYGQTLIDKNITLNIFLNPKTPKVLYSDRYKIKSLMIHLINNIFNFTNDGGAIEIDLEFSDIEELLTIDVKGVQSHSSKEFKSFFKHKKVTHSLTSSDRGLGLSVSSNLINILGGRLKLSTVGINEHLFTICLPIKNSKKENRIEFSHSKVMKIAILMSEENHYALKNLIRYLISMGIDENHILIFQSPKKISNMKFSHLFCFENMFSSEVEFKNFSSVTVLKYSQNSLNFGENVKDTVVHELYINSYYGLELQKNLFPNMEIEDLQKNTLLTEDSFLSKFSNVIKKLKL